MTIRRVLDPDEVSFCEAAGWAAYYQRDWTRVLRLMVRLNRAQFGMGPVDAIAAALDTVRATAAFAPAANNLAATRCHLTRYFARARRSAGISADAAKLADRELDYWVVHRELANRRKADRADDDLTPLVEALARLHAAVFGSTPERMRVSAALRALAAARVDRITGGYSDDVAADWARIVDLLRDAYRAARAVDRRPTAAGARREVAS